MKMFLKLIRENNSTQKYNQREKRSTRKFIRGVNHSLWKYVQDFYQNNRISANNRFEFFSKAYRISRQWFTPQINQHENLSTQKLTHAKMEFTILLTAKRIILITQIEKKKKKYFFSSSYWLSSVSLAK